ncbi:MAG: hypothetical protein KAH86_09900 [Methanosarcinales archaeon]|nr:hypothetical protein [Methanosarcinales archaeon]
MNTNEYIKAELDLIKLCISAFLAAIFLIAIYNFETDGAKLYGVIIIEIVFLSVLVILFWQYLKRAKTLD